MRGRGDGVARGGMPPSGGSAGAADGPGGSLGGTAAVALDALRADADSWDEVAATLRAVAERVDTVRIPVAAFSFAGTEVAQAYEALRAKIALLLAGGAANGGSVAHALRTSADAYEADERAHVRRLRATG